MGQVAIKIDSAAERCVGVLMELIETRVTYVVQEAVIVIKVSYESYMYGPVADIIGHLPKIPTFLRRCYSHLMRQS